MTVLKKWTYNRCSKWCPLQNSHGHMIKLERLGSPSALPTRGALLPLLVPSPPPPPQPPLSAFVATLRQPCRAASSPRNTQLAQLPVLCTSLSSFTARTEAEVPCCLCYFLSRTFSLPLLGPFKSQVITMISCFSVAAIYNGNSSPIMVNSWGLPVMMRRPSSPQHWGY